MAHPNWDTSRSKQGALAGTDPSCEPSCPWQWQSCGRQSDWRSVSLFHLRWNETRGDSVVLCQVWVRIAFCSLAHFLMLFLSEQRAVFFVLQVRRLGLGGAQPLPQCLANSMCELVLSPGGLALSHLLNSHMPAVGIGFSWWCASLLSLVTRLLSIIST